MPSRRPLRHKPSARLAVDTEFGAFLGDTRIKLLEAIDRYGSITQAARAVPLSYKAAWDAVDAMNNLAEQPLVERSVGGRHGGGTNLTDYGRRLVNVYRAMEGEYQTALDHLWQRIADADSGEVADFQMMLRRMSLRTSARNQFAGTVSGLREGEVSFEVRLRLDADNELAAVITREAAETLGLAIGVEMLALVNANNVLISTDENLRMTARNQLWGEVANIHKGQVDCEVTLALPGGRSVTAVLTEESLGALGLELGSRACAVFKAPTVMLIRLG
ncbi:TOBE domain-containing protein [Derxia gummosa]|uniref:TOBE domain-containing protein n=1 Tax=Derxia gummosa DSM 723 TaxID=1121388 RepID=A0A8B6X6N7_9BURK|nr:TOBE domain-containing protein [Derxia gummosa]